MEMMLISAGLFAMVALPFVALGLVITTRQLIRITNERDGWKEMAINNANRIAMLEGWHAGAKMRRRPEDYPPGTVPIELAEELRDEWEKAGFHVSKTKCLRMVSIAHRCMCEHQPGSHAPTYYNDGDRSAPAGVSCQGLGGCHWPDCSCEAVAEPPPIRGTTDD